MKKEIQKKTIKKIAEPVEIKETDEAEKDDIIASVLQKGYMMGEKIIRPAKVAVYRYTIDT